jgi:DNA repair photolyase
VEKLGIVNGKGSKVATTAISSISDIAQIVEKAAKVVQGLLIKLSIFDQICQKCPKLSI